MEYWSTSGYPARNATGTANPATAMAPGSTFRRTTSEACGTQSPTERTRAVTAMPIQMAITEMAPGEDVVTFPGLRIGHVQVDAQTDTGDDEQREDRQEAVPVLPEVPVHADGSQEQRDVRHAHAHVDVFGCVAERELPVQKRARQRKRELLHDVFDEHVPELVPEIGPAREDDHGHVPRCRTACGRGS